MADKDQFKTVEGLEGGFELMDEAPRASRAGWSSIGAVKKAAAVAAAVALALALAGCSTVAKPESKSTMAASDASMSASSSSSAQPETKRTDEANAAGAEPASSSSMASSDGDGVDNPLTEADVESLVFQNGLGAFDSAQLFQGGDGHWYWSVVTRDTANEPHTWTVDADGNFTSADSASANDGGVDNTLTEADVQQIVFDQGLGAYRYASLIEGDDGVWYWQVCVGDIYDNDHFLLIDPYGNVTEQ